MGSSVDALRQFLRSPTAFFEERPPAETLPVAAGLVVLFTVALVGSLLLVGAMLAGAVDATVAMDNPDRPPGPLCSEFGGGPHEVVAENCDEPETIERDGGELVRNAVHDLLWVAVAAPFVVWMLGGVVLFAGGRLAGGTPSIRGTLALAGWATVPEFARLAAGLVGLRVALADVRITDLERGTDAVASATAEVGPILAVATLLAAAWQWVLLTGGLSQDADVPRRAAAIATGVPLALLTILGLL